MWKRSHNHKRKNKSFQFQHFKLQMNTTAAFNFNAFNLSNHSWKVWWENPCSYIHTEVNCEEHIFFVQSDSDPSCSTSMKAKAQKSGADQGALCHQYSHSIPTGLTPPHQLPHALEVWELPWFPSTAEHWCADAATKTQDMAACKVEGVDESHPRIISTCLQLGAGRKEGNGRSRELLHSKLHPQNSKSQSHTHIKSAWKVSKLTIIASKTKFSEKCFNERKEIISLHYSAMSTPSRNEFWGSTG